MKRRAQPETKLQQAVATYLMLCLKPPAWWTSIEHGVEVAPAVAQRWASIGVKPGIPDVLIVHDGRCYWIECKAEKGTLSSAQLDTHEKLMHAGSTIHVCRSVDDLRRSLTLWDIPTREHAERRAA